jgi:hypothetical protein
MSASERSTTPPEERPCAREPGGERTAVARRQYERRAEPDLENPQWDAGAPSPARRVGELEATEEMDDPGQHNHDAEDREQEGGFAVHQEHHGAGYNPDRTGCERHPAARSLHEQAPLEVTRPLSIQ